MPMSLAAWPLTVDISRARRIVSRSIHSTFCRKFNDRTPIVRALVFGSTVEAISTNPAALTVESVTVPVGQSSAPLLVNVLEGGASVQVSVTLGAQTLQATIVTG